MEQGGGIQGLDIMYIVKVQFTWSVLFSYGWKVNIALKALKGNQLIVNITAKHYGTWSGLNYLFLIWMNTIIFKSMHFFFFNMCCA